eukprot:scaffold248381_cov99-Cyclotella_meneghiniana.AAC.1
MDLNLTDRIPLQPPSTMTTKLHTITALATLSTIDCLIYFNPSSLIGYLYGPQAQLSAIDQYISLVYGGSSDSSPSSAPISAVVDKYYHQFTDNETSLHAQDDAYSRCDAYNTAYQEFTLPRDAGIIASLFTIMLLLLPKFLSVRYTRQQYLCFLLLLPLLSLTPGLMGQIILTRSIPIELSFLKLGVVRGMGLIQYCSMQSFVSGSNVHHDGSMEDVLLYDSKLVGLAASLLFVVLGILPQF